MFCTKSVKTNFHCFIFCLRFSFALYLHEMVYIKIKNFMLTYFSTKEAYFSLDGNSGPGYRDVKNLNSWVKPTRSVKKGIRNYKISFMYRCLAIYSADRNSRGG